jgi:decaprenylphospho-beta-D-ribofuranose 2-oxidase
MSLPSKQVPRLAGWGGYPAAPAKLVRPERLKDFSLQEGVQIARGQGRSYGDAAICSEGTTILTERMNRFLDFDEETGVLRAEAGATLAEILTHFVPKGWFVPVTPGTKFCSLGGCLAADVHGKNHHHDGSFSYHVTQAVLVDGLDRPRVISPETEPEAFWATAGGMGLTGLIQEVSLKLQKIETSYVSVTHRAARNLEEAVALMEDPSKDDHCSVAWIDCLARGNSLGRSVVMTGHSAARNELPPDIQDPLATWHQGKLRVPFNFPGFALNPLSVRLFNQVYGAMQGNKNQFITHFDKFYYPLDGITGWNKIYGKRGFIQYQIVVPPSEGTKGMKEIISRLAGAGHGSFLAVLKKFGPQGQGMLSFPTEGWTLALDLPFNPKLLGFLNELDQIVADCGGRQYLAKDSRFAARHLPGMYPRLEEFRAACLVLDPLGKFRSDLSRRLGILP